MCSNRMWIDRYERKSVAQPYGLGYHQHFQPKNIINIYNNYSPQHLVQNNNLILCMQCSCGSWPTETVMQYKKITPQITCKKLPTDLKNETKKLQTVLFFFFFSFLIFNFFFPKCCQMCTFLCLTWKRNFSAVYHSLYAMLLWILTNGNSNAI